MVMGIVAVAEVVEAIEGGETLMVREVTGIEAGWTLKVASEEVAL